MPRARSEKAVQAEELFRSGMSMPDISAKLDVPQSSVRAWKCKYGWGDNATTKKRSVTKKKKSNAKNKPKKKSGAQPGNKNAVGGRGNPHPTPVSALKHGGYRSVMLDCLDDDEKDIFDNIAEDEELLLIEQIKVFAIRERRILKAIAKYRDSNSELAVIEIDRQEVKRTFANKDEEEEYNRRQADKVDRGDILPGKAYTLTTQTQNKDMVVLRLEQELSTVQGKMTKAIDSLARIRLEKQKISGDTKGNDVVRAWAAAVMEARRDKDE